jgi:RNA polymerase sigma factor (sigma-70 family)
LTGRDNGKNVAKYRTDNIAQLARQLTFTPHDTRLAQLAAAEELLHSIDPAKAYPLDYVVFRITGYHAKRVGVSHDLLTGMALQHDLGLLIERLSDTLDLDTSSLAEPVLTIDDVTQRFNVTSKTIQRWRRRGLPARRFVFADGKRRVGFLIGSVERFFALHRDQVQRGTNFSQVDDDERDQILRRARRLAEQCHCCPQEIARRIARTLNRSPLTILHTIRKHDEEVAGEAIFARAADSPGDEERARIVRLFKKGMPIARLARRLGRTRTAIYRILIDERIERMSKRKVRFIDDPLYHEPNADSFLRAMLEQEELSAPQRPEDARVPRDLPPYLAELYRTPLLSPAKERALFLKFNFHKYQFVQARRRLEPQFARNRDIEQKEHYLRDATETKNAIVRANLRLVVSIARRHLRPSLSLMELVSDGNVTLMRAVESFDVHKGNRFSTYATLALMKGFARSVPTMLAAQRGAGASDARDEMFANLPDARMTGAAERGLQRDELRQMLGRLDDREREVLSAHYGLNDSSDAATFEQVGERLGISKQRVRQIEQKALAKLRAVLHAPVSPPSPSSRETF